MPRLHWGDDGMLWGTSRLFWGAFPEGVAADPHAVWFHALVKVELEGGTIRVWSGPEDLEFEEGGTMNTWQAAGQTLEIGAMSSHTVASDDRLVIGFNALREEYRERWLVPVGPRPVEVRLIASDNHGVSWAILTNQIKRGLMSNPRYQDGVYRFSVVHPFEVRQRLKPLVWSHENQIARYPGDTGLAFMRQVASGVESEWPHVESS